MIRLAFVSTNRFKYSETFIHAQFRGLPFEKWLLHGGYMPSFVSRSLEEEGIPLAEAHPVRFWQKREGDGGEGALVRFLKKEKIDLVLAQYGPAGLAVLPAAERAGVPLLTHFHGYDAYRSDILDEQGQHYPELFRRSAGQVVVSQDMRQQLLELGADSQRVHWIPYGVDSGLFAPDFGAKRERLVVSVGRLTAKKGPLHTLRAFARVLTVVPEARLVWVGAGEMEADFQEEIVRLGLGDAVEWLGQQSPKEVAGWMQKAQVYVQHSLRPESGDSEGLPLAILEAMAAGLPVVATRHAGIPDAIRDGQEGRLVEMGDVAGMARHLIELLQAPEQARRMGNAARQRVEDRYTVDRYLGDLSRLIEEVVAGNGHPFPQKTRA